MSVHPTNNNFIPEWIWKLFASIIAAYIIPVLIQFIYHFCNGYDWSWLTIGKVIIASSILWEITVSLITTFIVYNIRHKRQNKRPVKIVTIFCSLLITSSFFTWLAGIFGSQQFANKDDIILYIIIVGLLMIITLSCIGVLELVNNFKKIGGNKKPPKRRAKSAWLYK